MSGKFEVFQDKGKKTAGYRWRLKSANGKVVAQSEGYTRHFDARRACIAVHEASKGAKIIDLVAIIATKKAKKVTVKRAQAAA